MGKLVNEWQLRVIADIAVIARHRKRTKSLAADERD
jgi:hypothetical protein